MGMNLQELIENSFCLNNLPCIIGRKVGTIEVKKIGDKKTSIFGCLKYIKFLGIYQLQIVI